MSEKDFDRQAHRRLMESMRPMTKEHIEERDRLLAPLMQNAPAVDFDPRMTNAVRVSYAEGEIRAEPIPWWKFWKR